MRVGKGGTLDKMDKALSRERALSQLSDKVVLNVLLPHVRVGAYKHPHKRVRIARRRPVISRLRERLDIRGGGGQYSPLHRAREEMMHMIQWAMAAAHWECGCDALVRVRSGEPDGLDHFSALDKAE